MTRYINLAVNLCYAVLKTVCGIVFHSAWIGTLANRCKFFLHLGADSGSFFRGGKAGSCVGHTEGLDAFFTNIK